MSYHPLPKSLTIKKSIVQGLGLFSKTRIPKDTNLGLTHVIINGTILRTPLGGFYNHSDDANCIKFEKDSHSNYDNTYYFLKTIKDIEEGVELTVKYTLYNIE